jgi:8-hydroxy-5-deazaflavin:NADPH oxidoreductase
MRRGAVPAPADLGGLADAGPMEAPRRLGAVYGEEYRPAEARAVVEALAAGRPVPPAPRHWPHPPGRSPR